ncbi:MAG: M20/M25/M40 family metallo-hydrolase [Oscillospiraceae bacterium]|nr:M20/M25/M40 family metallo-hydrolase [Oscillospiraceae bacterium]
MTQDTLLSTVDALTEEYLQIWEDVCNIESPSTCKEGVDAVGRYCIAIAQKKGWQVEICQQEVSGDAVCITMNADVDAAPVAVSGHMDTVHPVGSFGIPTVRRDEEKLYGPGVLDCKSGVVLGLFVLDVLDRCGYRKRPVKLLLQSDEEVGSRTSNKATINWICQQAKDAVAFLNLENSRGNTAGISRTGIARYEFTVTGKATHSASCDSGANAIAQAAHMILELEKLKQRNILTCNCGLISGGATPNSVPEKCIFVADIRYRDDEQLEIGQNLVKKVSTTEYVPGCSSTCKQISYRVSMPVVKRNLELLDRVNEILKAAGMSTLEPVALGGGSDAADVTAAGIPCLDGLGPMGGGVHSLNEFAFLSSMPAAAKRIATILSHL